jgi:hypothetical protein
METLVSCARRGLAASAAVFGLGLGAVRAAQADIKSGVIDDDGVDQCSQVLLRIEGGPCKLVK